jgi:GDYXXLXY protein
MSLRVLIAYAALALPLIGLTGATAMAWLQVRDGREWELPVRGFDPRDLLRGHYIEFQYDVVSGPECASDVSCCLHMFTAGNQTIGRLAFCSNAPAGSQARVVAQHDGLRLSGDVATGRMFIDERYAAALDTRLRAEKPNASVRFHISPSGKLTPLEILLDGKAYTQALQR